MPQLGKVDHRLGKNHFLYLSREINNYLYQNRAKICIHSNKVTYTAVSIIFSW